MAGLAYLRFRLRIVLGILALKVLANGFSGVKILELEMFWREGWY
jgi:hypothetical protein